MTLRSSFSLLAGAIALLAGCAQMLPFTAPSTVPEDTARRIAGVTVPPPLPPQPQVDTMWGVQVPDPYRFVEDLGDPMVQQWMKGQAAATSTILARVPGRESLLARIREIDAAAAGSISRMQRTARGRVFFTRREPGENQFRLVMRESLAGEDRLLVDAEAIGKEQGKRLAILDYAASENGRWLAYTLQVGGSEIGELHVIDVDSGQPITAPIDRIRFADVHWLDDGSGFFFSRLREGFEKLPADERFGDRTAHFFSMRTRQSQPVFSASRNKELGLPIYADATLAQIAGSRRVAAYVSLGVDRNVMLYVADLKAATEGRAQWRRVVDRSDEAREIAIAGGWIYVLSAKGAPRYRILRTAVSAPDLARAEAVVPTSESVLVRLWAARDALYFARRSGAAMQLVRVPHRRRAPAETVALPFEGTVSMLDADARRDGGTVSVVGWTRAVQRFDYQPPRGRQPARLLPLALAKSGAFDAPPEMTVREAVAPSHDGVLVPVSIIARRDVKLDGSHPTVVFGYGAYGITQNPFFNPWLLAWLERGGVYVYAHVRGGGLLGSEWYLAGKEATKPNTWRDGVSVAEWLVREGYTSPRRLAIVGGSAGGIFVGRAITERPDLFAAAVPVVGVMDTVRAETDPNGVANIPEFGTVKNEAGFRALLQMSSYHHVKDGARYPATLLVHGVNDTRVSVWQSVKFANRLAAATRGGPVLLRLDYDLGHGGGSTRAQQLAQTADIWSFLLWQFGVPEFQPKP